MTEQPFLAKYLAVSAPIPEFPPVTMAVFPARSMSPEGLKTPPEKYLLTIMRKTRMPIAIAAQRVVQHS